MAQTEPAMRDEVAERLITINQELYRHRAAAFAQSRARPAPGFTRLSDSLPRPCSHLLDLGCGEGRLGRFLLERRAIGRYTGLDFSPELLALARSQTAGEFYIGELSRPDCLERFGDFPAIACLATLQHIPGRANRLRLLCEAARHLAPGGRVVLSNWQFVGSPRQQRKVVPWSAVGLSPGDVEANDYLLTWQRGGAALRYVALIDLTETVALAGAAGLVVVDYFRSDGREGDLSLYAILEAGRSADKPGVSSGEPV
jgi:SAM-dependent methyltransferase